MAVADLRGRNLPLSKQAGAVATSTAYMAVGSYPPPFNQPLPIKNPESRNDT